MLPIVQIPETVRDGMQNYRDVFCRDEGFDYVSRYVTGLIISPNKTLQGIYDLQVWDRDRKKPSRRAMHGAVFEAGWGSDALIQRHRAVVAPDHRGRGREVISLDWTFAHHDRGPEIYASEKGYDYVENRPSRYQTVVTAVISNSSLIDGLDVVVQEPGKQKEEMAYLRETVKRSYDQMVAVSDRLLELLHHLKHEREYKKRTEIALELVQQIEQESHFPDANYAFDNGVLSLDLTRYIQLCGKHWVSELECSRNIQWHGDWVRLDSLATELREKRSEGFRFVRVECRNGETNEYWAYTQVVRLKRYGRKRLVIVHEKEDLSDPPRYLLTSANHWNSGRTIQTWSYRWSSEVFHEFAKQVTGFESSQVRKEEAVKRHFRLSCVSQSLIQRASAVVSESERYEFAKGKTTFGQRCRTIAREVFRSILELSKRLFAEGKSCDQVLDMLMPA
jgi:dsDNA-binding SOS-regulon protein